MDITLQPKQQIAFTTEATELLYGGAVGGGKSVLLRSSAIRWCVEVPGIQVYLFRRTLRDLRDNHLRGPMSFFYLLSEHLKTGHVKYRSVENEFIFWNGSYLHLCYCDSENDVENYRGSEMHVLLMDELTHFSDFQYRFLRGRVRLAGLEIPPQYKSRLPRIEAGSNPGSIGHAWVKRTFVSPKPELEIWDTPPEEGGMKRQFIPARLADNVHLLRDDPKYADRVRGLGGDHLVRAMLDGDWDIVAGQAFEKLHASVHQIEPFEPPAEWQIFGSLDWGSSKPFSFGMWCVANGDKLPDGRWLPRGAIVRYDEWYGWTSKPNEGQRLEVKEVAEGIKGKLSGRRPAYIIADPSMWKVDGGPSHAETMLRYGVVLRKADNSRFAGYLSVRDRIAGDDDGPMMYAAKNCHAGFWRTMPNIIMDDRHVEDVDTDQEDHCFVADTLVCTYNGYQRIGDLVGSEGFVWTGKWEPYRSCRMTRRNAKIVEVEFNEGTSVHCTPDHRFLLESGLWCQAKNLVGQKVQRSFPKRHKSFLGLLTGCADFISSAREVGSIDVSGKRITARSQEACTYTTSTGTGAITAFPTWLFSAPPGMCLSISRTLEGFPSQDESLRRFERRRPTGMVAMRALSGIKNTIKSIVLKLCTEGQRKNVDGVMQNSWACPIKFFALGNVTQQNVATLELTTKIGRVASVVLFFASTGIEKLSHALQSAMAPLVQESVLECRSLKELKNEDVYCLTVPESSRFTIQGGVMVSNCYDDVRYACMSRPWVRIIEKKPEPVDRWDRAFARDAASGDSWRTE